MTPAQAALDAYRLTRDWEAAFLAGYRAEGLIGKGKAPDYVDGRKAARDQTGRKTGVMAGILSAIRNGATTSRAVAEEVGICTNYASAYLTNLAAQGKVRHVGNISMQGASYAKLWEVVD